MTDTHRSTGAPPAGAADRSVRPLRWLLLAISAALNVATSVMGVSVLVSMGFGLIALACGVTLAVRHLRSRRR